MITIIDYTVQENALFSNKTFQAVDSLVLSQLAYLYFDGFVSGIAEMAEPVTLKEIAARENREELYRNTRDSFRNKKLLLALAGNPRFCNTKINYYVNKLDYDKEKQFSAVTFYLDDGTAYIAFRGTDSTFIGWKEDFNMAFSSVIPSQEESVLYLNIVGRLMPGNLKVGGHSKGGNLAAYAAMKCESGIRDRITDIFSHDGPGFREEVFRSKEYRNVEDHIHHFIPQSSLIGMLLEHHEKYEVVKSGRIGIMQHDPFSWLVKDGDFQYLKDINNIAAYTNRSLQVWLDSLDDESRELFVDTLYNVIKATGAKSFSDLAEDWWEKSRAILDAVWKIDEETRHFVLQTVRSLIVMAVKSLRVENGITDSMKEADKKRTIL